MAANSPTRCQSAAQRSAPPPLHQVNARKRRGRRRWNRRGGKDERARAINQKIGQRPRTANVAAGGAERFAEGSHLDFDAAGQSGRLGDTAAAGAIKPRGVGLIEHEPCAIAFFEIDQRAQWRLVAIHGEDALGNNQDPRRSGASRGRPGGLPAVRPGENTFQALQIIVSENAQPGAAQPGGVNDRGVHKAIENDDVVAAEQRANRSQCGGVTAGKAQGGFGSLEGGKSGVEFVVRP